MFLFSLIRHNGQNPKEGKQSSSDGTDLSYLLVLTTVMQLLEFNRFQEQHNAEYGDLQWERKTDQKFTTSMKEDLQCNTNQSTFF